MSRKSVAIIGFGVSGVSSVVWCKKVGLEVTVFEKRARTGGVWAPDASNDSPIWKQLHLNTPGFYSHLTQFPPERNSKFVHNTTQRDYLERYADHHKLLSLVHFQTTVERARREQGRWTILWTDSAGARHMNKFDHVLLATGRYSGSPIKLEVPGIESFSGLMLHSHDC
jgi:cation diffusion facilitator CzcD-associated flavoprotein CzcO